MMALQTFRGLYALLVSDFPFGAAQHVGVIKVPEKRAHLGCE